MHEVLATLFIILAMGLWFYTIWIAMKATHYQNGNKLMWMLLLFLAPGLGVVLYLAVGRPREA
jgi:uncharacterized membrane protein